MVQEESGGPADARLPRAEGSAWPAPIYVKSLAASDADAANDPDARLRDLPEPTADGDDA